MVFYHGTVIMKQLGVRKNLSSKVGDELKGRRLVGHCIIDGGKEKAVKTYGMRDVWGMGV